ncbi:MAG: ECF transporter S component [Clostridia bacterium]|nr:ECF transporter S component [Clostridia bacterium]
MRESQNQKILRLVQLAMLAALVVVLQVISALIPPVAGAVSITFTLVPVVVGAILFGVKGGAILGFAFGLIVLINCITGLDIGGNLLWSANPFFTAIICFIKGVMAGIIPALLYKAVKGKSETVGNGRKFVAALVAALSAPIVNTGLFICGMFLLFNDTLYAWAGDTNVITYVLVGLAGINFLVEFLINIILTPAIVRIVEVVKKNKK